MYVSFPPLGLGDSALSVKWEGSSPSGFISSFSLLGSKDSTEASASTHAFLSLGVFGDFLLSAVWWTDIYRPRNFMRWYEPSQSPPLQKCSVSQGLCAGSQPPPPGTWDNHSLSGSPSQPPLRGLDSLDCLWFHNSDISSPWLTLTPRFILPPKTSRTKFDGWEVRMVRTRVVLATGAEEKALTPLFRSWVAVAVGWGREAEPLLCPGASGWTVASLGSVSAAGSEHVLGRLRELTTQSPRESLRKSRRPLPATWPCNSGFLWKWL